MDPITTLVNCYRLYDSIQERLDTIESNRNQFDLLKQKVAEIAEPIDRLKTLHSQKQLPCSDKALEGLHRTLEKVQVFVQQKRFSKPKKLSASNVLNLVAALYHGADDKEQFVQFDRMLSSSLQSLNLHITVKILDYTMAATRDAAQAAESTAAIQLTQIDTKKLDWNPNSSSSKIGYGAFSTVCTGRYKKEYVAIKVIQQLGGISARDLKLITKEAMVMQFAEHPNILKLKGVSLAKGLLVMELALCSLADYLHRPNDLARERCQSLRAAVPTPLLQWKLNIVRDVADAIRYLHSFSILHRDIKSANVLLFHDPTTGKTTAKVGDFGLALAVELVSRTAGTMQTASASTLSSQGSQSPRAAGTPNYMAPELFDRRPGESIAYSEASDVYSLGVLANEVLTESIPWDLDAREVDVMKWVLHDHLRPQPWTAGEGSDDGTALLRTIGDSDAINSCWNQRPSQRCTAEDVYLSTRVETSPGRSLPLPTLHKAEVSAESESPSADLPPSPPPLPVSQPAKLQSPPSSPNAPMAYSRVASDDDGETAKLAIAFAEDIHAALPQICEERARQYATELVKENIFDVTRLLKLTRALATDGKLATNKWFQKCNIHPFDAADMMTAADLPPTSVPAPRRPRQVLLLTKTVNANLGQCRGDHGISQLVAWLKAHVPDVVLPHKRQHIAEALYANNITCAERLWRLADRADAVPWLLCMQIDKLDAEDVCTSASDMYNGRVDPRSLVILPTFPTAVEIPATLALYDLDDFVALLAAQLQQLIPDMIPSSARRCGVELFTKGIYTTPRFLRQLQVMDKKSVWLKSLGWSDFDVADLLDIVEFYGASGPPALSVVSEPQGVAPLVQWLTDHLPSLKLASRRQQYADALVANNVSTVHRLIVRGNSEAWLVRVGFDKLDAADCAAVLAPLAKKDAWAVVKAKKAATAAEAEAAEVARAKALREQVAAEAQRVRAERCTAITAPFSLCYTRMCAHCGYNRYPGRLWLPSDNYRSDDRQKRQRDFYIALKPCCCLFMSPVAVDAFFCGASHDEWNSIGHVICIPYVCFFGCGDCVYRQTCANCNGR